MKQKILRAIYSAIDEINETLNRFAEKSENTVIVGKGSKLDSLAVVHFLLAVEDNIKKEFGADLYLFDEIESLGTVKALAEIILGKLTRKIIIVDLDDTLWDGIVGDDGWENLRVGKALNNFQRALKLLAGRGVLLGIVSKNEEAIALEAIDKHSGMVLRCKDFAGWRINWEDKAQNIVDLMDGLNLGLESAVFIDDSPVERARVREALPEVLVPDWPVNLENLKYFPTSITAEDSQRSKMYQVERKRRDLKKEVGSFDEWLNSLEIKVGTGILHYANLRRATQLLNKSNQMNLSTRRMTESELMRWSRQSGHKLWVFRVSDKFGDYGLTGILSFIHKGDEGKIVDFVLSCRVMGRGVGKTMLYHADVHARALNLAKLSAKYLPTPKNAPCLRFFQESGFDEKNNTFSWNPRHV